MYQTRPRKQESPRPHQHHSTNLISKALKESLLILRPLTHLSGGVIPFSRESVDSLAGSPLSLFTFMVRDSIRSLVLPLVAFKLVWLSGIYLSLRWYSLGYRFGYSFCLIHIIPSIWVLGCELMYLGFALMYGSLPWAISSLATNYTLATRLV